MVCVMIAVRGPACFLVPMLSSLQQNGIVAYSWEPQSLHQFKFPGYLRALGCVTW